MIFHRALQLPKEYPELVDGTTLPDSSTRLTSPAPSSEGASPAPNGCSTRGTDCGTQTEALVTTSIAIQADFAIVEVKVDKVEKKELKEEVEGDEEVNETETFRASNKRKREETPLQEVCSISVLSGNICFM